MALRVPSLWRLQRSCLGGRGVQKPLRRVGDKRFPGKGAGSLAEDSIGAVVEGVERGNHAAATDPDKWA